MAEVFTTSHLRANVIAWLPIKVEDKVLYIGTEAVIAEKLKEMSQHTNCVGNLEEIVSSDKYDYIILLGSVEENVLQTVCENLKDDGRLVLAVENAYGLKYLAGAKEIGSKEYFGGVEAVNGSQGYTRQELLHTLKSAGFTWQDIYYPFPDYQFAMSLYSEEYLPKQGELIDQIGNFDEERLVLFDEGKAADAVIARGKFEEFSNAYLIIAGKGTENPVVNDKNERISYVKYSNDRGRIHNIRTYITKSSDGKSHLLKMADSKEAASQVANLSKTEQVLKELYADSRLKMNVCQEREDAVEFEFLKGHTMEEVLDGFIEQKAYDKATDLMFSVFQEISSCKNMQEFQMTEEFQKVFGLQELPSGLQAVPVGDIDMIMPNILVGEDDTWTVIDYEWSFHFPIPVHFIIYRAIRYYADTTATRRVLDAAKLYEKAGITELELKAYEDMEDAFQRYVLDGHIPMRQRYREEGKPAYHLTSLLHIKHEIEHKRMMQVYFDRGNGTREEDCMNYHSKSLDGEFHLEIPVDEDVIAVRIDPAGQACTADIERLCFTTSKEKIVEFYGPVHKVGNQIYLFQAEDPYLLITDIPKGEKKLLIDMRVDTMSLAAAELIAPKIDTKYRIKKMLKK